MTKGHSSTVVRGTWEAVRNLLVTGELPRWRKEMMFVAISKDRDCRYCTAAHIACCRMLGANSKLLENYLVDKIGWLKACQKRSEELATILWIHLKITGQNNCYYSLLVPWYGYSSYPIFRCL